MISGKEIEKYINIVLCNSGRASRESECINEKGIFKNEQIIRTEN